MKYRKATTLSVALLLVSLGCVVFYVNRTQPPLVKLATASEERLETTFTADGVVKGVTTHVSARVVARIQSIDCDEGDEVQPGAVLVRLVDETAIARIRSAESTVASSTSVYRQAQTAVGAAEARVNGAIRTAEAQLGAAKSRLNQAKTGSRVQEVELARHKLEASKAAHEAEKKSAERARKLYEEGAISLAKCEAAETREALAKQDLEAAMDAYDLAKTGPRPVDIAAAEEDVKLAQSVLEQARTGKKEVDLQRSEVAVALNRVREATSALSLAKSALFDLTLKAPTSGRILRKHLEPGDITSPGVPILDIVDARGTYIEGELSDSDVGKAVVGDEVIITAASYPGRQFPGKITQIAASAELKPDVSVRTRIVRMRVVFDGPSPGFKVGMEVDIEGKSAPRRSVLVVPSDAITFGEDEAEVWVYADGKVQRVAVKIGLTTPSSIEILHGLKAGDRVVVDGKEGLTDGQTVRPGAP